MQKVLDHKWLRASVFFLLSPLAGTWEAVYWLRRAAHNYGLLPQEKFRVPVVSVGNITFGGTGKTPFTLWLGTYLERKQKKVMILMRGYRGRLEKSSGLLKGGAKLGHNPLEFGDEALVLSRRLPCADVAVGRNRVENLEKYFDQVRPDVVLLDDGHQHLRLARNLNIVLFDALMPLSRYRVAPLGYLREGPSALRDADVVVFTRCDQVSEEKLKALESMVKPYVASQVPFARLRYLPTGVYGPNYRKLMDLDGLKGRNVICVAGVASPASFFAMVQELGAKIIKKIAFPDHHFFTTEEIKAIVELARNEDALVLTTEKDMVKVRRTLEDERLAYLEVAVDFLDGEVALKERIDAALEDVWV